MIQVFCRIYRVRWLLASVLLMGVSSCQKLNSVVDAPSVFIPEMHVLSVVSDRIDADTLPGGTDLMTDLVTVALSVSVAASDSTGITGVAGSVFSPDWVLTNQPSALLANFPLTQNGTDSVFKGQVSFQIFRFEVGTYTIRLQAFNGLGTATVPVNYFVQIFNSKNHPPVLDSAFSIPNPVVLGNAVTLEAKVTDPEGQFDIQSVTASLAKPDGSSWKTVSLFDDGLMSHNDRVKGDSVYSASVRFDSTATPSLVRGMYTCHINATDKSGATARDSFTVVVQ